MKILVVILLLNASGDIEAGKALGAVKTMQQCADTGEAATAAIIAGAGGKPEHHQLVTLCVDISKGEQRHYGTEI